MNIAQGDLAIVDGKVYWKGAFVPVETLFLHYDGDTKIIRFEVGPGADPAVLAEIEASGVKVRRSK